MKVDWIRCSTDPTPIPTGAGEDPSDLRETSRDAEDSVSIVGAKSIAVENNRSEEDVDKGGKNKGGLFSFGQLLWAKY
jgi:hypothetical protein